MSGFDDDRDRFELAFSVYICGEMGFMGVVETRGFLLYDGVLSFTPNLVPRLHLLKQPLRELVPFYKLYFLWPVFVLAVRAERFG